MKNDENSKLNKDFNLSQKADEAQKAREEERQKQIEGIKSDKDRKEVKEMMRTRDEEVRRDVALKHEEQQKTVRDEIDRRIADQRTPKLDFTKIKSITGKSPQDIADKVRAEFKAHHERELASFGAGAAAPFNNLIDKKLETVLEQQRQKEAEPAFERETTRSPDSSRDGFQKAHDQTGGEKDWRSLRADREREAENDRER
ncbi:hypothetical protein SAMN04488523_1681 [Sulfitobacter brevis]|uniref:Uncharacterized protein n=1 Tax=Sulfitobacter brevis TaxID=74348 RepID=A0A1I2HSS7_9RHOB|nr:hypothetical protein [Sulfitobacter brevis]SFF31431.1 hypothetical protein SAMN04488523_1681 [Sulfitobacter brevis]